MKSLKLQCVIIIFVFCFSFFSLRASADVSPTPTIVWTDGFENDPLGRQFTWGDNSGLNGGYLADISAGTAVNIPYSYFEVVSDAAEGSHSLAGYLYGSTPCATGGTPMAHRFCKLIEPANAYYSKITGAMYVSWKMKFTQWQPAYKDILIFHLGTYTTPTQRFVVQINRSYDGLTQSLSVSGLYNNGAQYWDASVSAFTFNLGTWYTFEAAAYESNTNGFYKLWINGNKVLDETGLNNLAGLDFGTAAWNKRTFEVGVEVSAGPNEVTGDVLFNIDDIKVGNINLGGTPPPSELEGTLTIETSPVNGEIFLDGVSLGLSPQSVTASVGTHIIGFGNVSGYQSPSPVTVTVEEGMTIPVHATYIPHIDSEHILTIALLLATVFVAVFVNVYYVYIQKRRKNKKS